MRLRGLIYKDEHALFVVRRCTCLRARARLGNSAKGRERAEVLHSSLQTPVRNAVSTLNAVSFRGQQRSGVPDLHIFNFASSECRSGQCFEAAVFHCLRTLHSMVSSPLQRYRCIVHPSIRAREGRMWALVSTGRRTHARRAKSTRSIGESPSARHQSRGVTCLRPKEISPHPSLLLLED